MSRGLVRAVCAAVLASLLCAPVAGATIRAEDELPKLATRLESTVDRTMTDGRISESSGLVASQRHTGVVWTLNDSGNAAELYAIAADGSVAAAVAVPVRNRDWEALSSWQSPAGQNYLMIGDIGDNNAAHKFSHLYLIAEPGLGDTSATVAAHIELTYAIGASDAEALAVDPRDGRIWILTKNLFGGVLLTIDPQAWLPALGTGKTVQTQAQPVAATATGLTTDAAAASDGTLVVRTYSDIYVFAAPEIPEPELMAQYASQEISLPTLKPVASGKTEFLDQSETLALLDDRSALIGTEGTGTPLLRVTLPLPGDSGTSAGGGTESGTELDPDAGIGADSPDADADADASPEANVRTALDRIEHLKMALIGILVGILGLIAALAALAWRQSDK